MAHVIDARECTVCGACDAQCPEGAVSVHSSDRFYVIDAAICTDCGECVEVCPVEAISPAEAP